MSVYTKTKVKYLHNFNSPTKNQDQLNNSFELEPESTSNESPENKLKENIQMNSGLDLSKKEKKRIC